MFTRVLRLAACAGCAIAIAAAPAFAQTAQFFDTLLPVYRAGLGTFGDEGPRLSAAIDTVAAALSREEIALRDAEKSLRAQLPGAAPEVALQVHTVLASMYIQRGQLADALREFNQDLLIDPKRPAFHRFAGLLYQALGRQDEAADAFRAAWLAAPSDPLNAYHLLVYSSPRTTAAERGQARMTLHALERALVGGQSPKAESPFLSVRPIKDDAGGAMAFAPAGYATAVAKLLNGQLEPGVADLRAAAAQDPLVTDPALRTDDVTRGIAALRAGRLNEALPAMQRAVMASPGSSEVRRVLAAAEIVSGDVTSALGHLRDAVKLNPKNERAWLALTSLLDDLGDWVAAGDALRTALHELPESGELWWQLLVISAQRQRTDAADLDLIANVDHLTVLVGTSELYERVATLAQGHLDYDRALALLQQAVILTPNRVRAHQLLGRAYIDQGHEDEGYAELVMALWLDPMDAKALTTLAQIDLTAGRYADASETLTRARAIDPDDPQILQALGEALVRMGNADAGHQYIDMAARLQERAVEGQRRARTAGMLSTQADVALAQRNQSGAIDLWRNAAALAPRDITIRLRLADTLIAANRHEEAAAELQQMVSLNAGPDAHRRLADIYDILGRGDDSARERRLYTDARLRQLQERSGDIR